MTERVTAAGALEAFVQRPLTAAAELASGGCGGTYAEASMLVSATISAVASSVWPGKGIDRKRFVQAWVDFGRPDAVRVSVPLLRQRLLEENRRLEATQVERLRPTMFGAGYRARILTGDEVDVDEETVRGACSSLYLRELRDLSYPSVFYEHVRSPVVHEYRLGDAASEQPMTSRNAVISYVNQLGALDLDSAGEYVMRPARHPRPIHFDVTWLLDHARNVARGADKALARGAVPKPAAWWSDAGRFENRKDVGKTRPRRRRGARSGGDGQARGAGAARGRAQGGERGRVGHALRAGRHRRAACRALREQHD